ncbi:hypothetical protein PsorP6_016056 [Peronosclerospora sorghi]|uniref:Uncharacterized protein n=1 Tax=Peronosclerospora sorghi TaxID=230839 RepID=A0ACC0WM79_9STRA|nr:hypothetical protein PsorP6_016056 [Peronosclerospora sorghi]
MMPKTNNGTTPAPADSKYPTPERSLSLLSSKSAAETLTKLKRNERDRQRSFAKRQTMQQMRLQVKELEEQKQHLIKRTSGLELTSSRNDEIRLASPFPSSFYAPSTTAIKREYFLSLTNEIEKFRHQNAVMTKQLREWEITTGYMQNLLLEYIQDQTDSESESSPCKRADSHGCSPRPSNGTKNVCFTPLTLEEGMTCVRQTLQLINNARIYFANDANYHNRNMFLGWEQYTLRQGSTIMFSVEKSLPNVTPAQLMDTMWDIMTDSSKTQKMMSSSLNVQIRLLQKFSEDLLIIDRRLEDNAQSGLFGQKRALRTTHLLLRTANTDGIHTLVMKTIDLPSFKKLLPDDEQWCEICYWIRFCPDGNVQFNSDNDDFATVTEFGCYNKYTCDEIAKAWLGELVFLAIRWESLAVTPTLLTF